MSTDEVVKDARMNLFVCGIEKYEANVPDRCKLWDFIKNCLQRDPRCRLHRIAERACRYRRGGDRVKPFLLGKIKGVSITLCQQRVGRLVTTVDRAETVNDVTVGQVVAARTDGLSGPDGCERPALLFETRAGGPPCQ